MGDVDVEEVCAGDVVHVVVVVVAVVEVVVVDGM